MNSMKQPFYCNLYHHSGRFFPTLPENQALLLGDFFQIQDGKCIPLGNIGDLEFQEAPAFSDPIALRSGDWAFHSGVHQCFSLTDGTSGDNGTIRRLSKQVFGFEEVGSHLFMGKDPQERLLLNWTSMKDELTLKMTQEDYGFREVYVVTGAVYVSAWGLLMAEQAHAHIAVSSEVMDADFFEWLFHATARIEESEHIHSVRQRQSSHPSFFKAKKLVMNEKSKEAYINKRLYQRQMAHGDEKASSFAVINWLKTDLMNLMKANELNPSTALGFFDWEDMTLDDLKRLA